MLGMTCDETTKHFMKFPKKNGLTVVHSNAFLRTFILQDVRPNENYIKKKCCCRRKMSNQLQEIQAIADTWRQDVCASRRIFKKQVEHEQVKEGWKAVKKQEKQQQEREEQQTERKKGTTDCRNPPNLC